MLAPNNQCLEGSPEPQTSCDTKHARQNSHKNRPVLLQITPHMKTELDNLMQQRSLDALLVSGGTHENPCMYYLANGAKVGAGTLAIKHRGHEPVLIVVGKTATRLLRGQLFQPASRKSMDLCWLAGVAPGTGKKASTYWINALREIGYPKARRYGTTLNNSGSDRNKI